MTNSQSDIWKYYYAIIRGEYGKILNKHKDLARQFKKGVTFEQVSKYVRGYKKYDNWSLRDIDKVCAIIFNR